MPSILSQNPLVITCTRFSSLATTQSAFNTTCDHSPTDDGATMQDALALLWSIRISQHVGQIHTVAHPQYFLRTSEVFLVNLRLSSGEFWGFTSCYYSPFPRQSFFINVSTMARIHHRTFLTFLSLLSHNLFLSHRFCIARPLSFLPAIKAENGGQQRVVKPLLRSLSQRETAVHKCQRFSIREQKLFFSVDIFKYSTNIKPSSRWMLGGEVARSSIKRRVGYWNWESSSVTFEIFNI